MLCMNQQQLALTIPWAGHLLCEHQIQTGGITALNTATTAT